MKCFKCGNDIEDNLECQFCGYVNKEEFKKNNKINNYDNIDNKKEYRNDKIENKIAKVICKILCYIQITFSIMMALVCLTLEKPFFPFFSWAIVVIAFIPKIKLIIIRKFYKIMKWIIPIRIILIVLAIIVFVCNLPQIFEDEWVSNDGISVTLLNNVAEVIENGIEYHGEYHTQYIDGITNIIVTTENKNFIFYFQYNDYVVEFYYIKDNNKVFLIPSNPNINYTYVKSENELN